MANSGRETLGWSEQQWTAIHDAIGRALASTAKCRQVIPKGPEKIGEKTVVIPSIGVAAGTPIGYGSNAIASPIHIFVDVNLDPQYAQSDADVIRLMEVAAAQLGRLEDQEIIQGGPNTVPAPNPLPSSGRFVRNIGLAREAAQSPTGGPPAIQIGAGRGAANPNGGQLYAAISNAIAALEGAGRPGRFGLLVHNNLMATLRQPRVAGGVPLIQEVEGLIGSSEIVGTSALDGSFRAGNIGAVLFRLEPEAMDLVHTLMPTVTVLGRTGGVTNLRIEEEIVLRILDPSAVQPIAY